MKLVQTSIEFLSCFFSESFSGILDAKKHAVKLAVRCIDGHLSVGSDIAYCVTIGFECLIWCSKYFYQAILQKQQLAQCQIIEKLIMFWRLNLSNYSSGRHILALNFQMGMLEFSSKVLSVCHTCTCRCCTCCIPSPVRYRWYRYSLSLSRFEIHVL